MMVTGSDVVVADEYSTSTSRSLDEDRYHPKFTILQSRNKFLSLSRLRIC
jgi:hypothetical protein